MARSRVSNKETLPRSKNLLIIYESIERIPCPSSIVLIRVREEKKLVCLFASIDSSLSVAFSFSTTKYMWVYLEAQYTCSFKLYNHIIVWVPDMNTQEKTLVIIQPTLRTTLTWCIQEGIYLAESASKSRPWCIASSFAFRICLHQEQKDDKATKCDGRIFWDTWIKLKDAWKCCRKGRCIFLACWVIRQVSLICQSISVVCSLSQFTYRQSSLRHRIMNGAFDLHIWTIFAWS